MKYKDFTGIIPGQYSGEEIETDASIELADEPKAKALYKLAKQKIMNVNNWHTVAGLISAKFQLVSSEGVEVEREVQKGDYFKIDIPGPGSTKGNGFDWVLVEEVKEMAESGIESLGIRVRPSSNPFNEKNETDHFYAASGTSNFIIIREFKTVSAWIVDRNIKPNQSAETITDKLRDLAVGIGAIGLFSKLQWSGLAKGLIDKEKQ